MKKLNENEFRLLKEYIQKTCGIAIPKEKQYLFATRLGKLLEELHCANFSELYFLVTQRSDKELISRLVEAMTTNETSFFRDEHPFRALVDRILPELGANKLKLAKIVPPRIRIWSVGCATGEEPYSVAMCAREWLDSEKRFTKNDVAVIAGDVSRGVLAKAKQAMYEERSIVGKVSITYQKKYFTRVGNKYRVNDDIRAMVIFSELNLNSVLERVGSFDLILCRNVIIYFDMDLKRRIINQFYNMLEPGGVLLMGASENLYNLSDKFESVQAGPTIYYRKEEPSNG